MHDSDPDSGSKSRLKSCALLSLGPMILLIGVLAVFLFNNRPPNVHIPTPKVPKDNGWDCMLRAERLTKGQGPVSSSRPQNSWTTAELRQFVADNQLFLVEVRRGLRKRWMQPPIRTTQRYGDTFMDYARIREVARKLLSMTRHYERAGQYGTAARIHFDALELGAVFPNGSGIISAMTGASIEAIGAYGLAPMLCRLSPVELAECARRLERIQSRRATFSEIIREEGRMQAAMYGGIFGGEDHLSMVANPLDWPDTPWWDQLRSGQTPVANIGVNARHAFSNKRAMVLSILRYCDALAVEQSGPYRGRSTVPLPSEPCAHSVLQDRLRYRAGFERDTTRLALLQGEVALRRYRLDHGALPASLSDMVPTYLRREPVDRFGLGRPLRYKLLNNGKRFLLYSLGPNLKDDGGKPATWQGASTPGDIISGK